MSDYSVKITSAASMPAMKSGATTGIAAGAGVPGDRAVKLSGNSGGVRSQSVDDLVEVNLERYAAELQRYIPRELSNTRLQITHDKESGLFVYRALDRRSGEVVKQFPAEEILNFISFFRERDGLREEN